MNCKYCVGEARREWWGTGAGELEKERARARQADFWGGVYADVASKKQELGARITADVAADVGGVSVPTVTRYYVVDRGWLEVEDHLVQGQRFFFYPADGDVKRVRRMRAKGPAWKTWLDPDWRVGLAHDDGTFERLLAAGLTPVQVEGAIRRPVEAARARLKPHRSGPLAADDPSPLNVERFAAWVEAERLLEEKGALATASKRSVARTAAELLAAKRPGLLPRRYVDAERLDPIYEETAIRLLMRAETACKSVGKSSPG